MSGQQHASRRCKNVTSVYIITRHFPSCTRKELRGCLKYNPSDSLITFKENQIHQKQHNVGIVIGCVIIPFRII
ncbi:hypothetical protein KsCSTR_31950 [Candidatus Kuenenia stuttgartiensis]|uniref:Uncharacterized protein n=1 Tax=Kuenenia stuttgartiensis TaxID=174633 RepID=Q1Q4T7_KUEST|nr:hypothetical protein KsCSTR_31950 [Candidatus Kuenenia stuttgartiensis]CAJ75033.1 unknown protein [Candidatus Kuenenia stuttgartiensis]